MSKNSIPIRSDKRFVDEIKDMKLKRMLRGKESKAPRLTLAITRHRLFPEIKLDIINADLT